MAKFFALASLVVMCVAVADLVANPKGTGVVANAGVSAERAALNAELGKTS
jgi:hypothetical protein